jgi:hypothetical protein
MVLLNFYLHVLIHYYFTASFDIFYHCFCLQGISASRHQQEAYLEALNDDGQQQMTGASPAWPELGVAQQKVLKEPDVGATQPEAIEEPYIKDEVDDHP